MKGWAEGMDNRLSNTEMPASRLRNIVNGVMTAQNRIRRRRGISQVIADANAHSVYSDGSRLFWATPTALKVATPPFFAPVTVLTNVRLVAPLSFVFVNGVVYFSNEQINGTIDVNGVYAPWGIIPPSVAPACVSVDSYATKDKLFQVTCTFALASGEESGAPLGVQVSCGDVPSIALTNIPQSSDSRVTGTRIYATDIDGDNFYFQAFVPAGVTSTTIQGPFSGGDMLDTQFMQPPPPGQLLSFINGRIYIASGNIVYMTQPMRYGICNLGALGDKQHDFYMFPQRVTLLKAVDNGCFVSSDITYFMSDSGTPKAQLQPRLPYKAYEGMACDVPNTRDVMWFSERGFVLGKSDGAVKNLVEDQIAVDSMLRGCIGFIEQNGVKTVVAISRDSVVSPLAADDYVSAEATRISELA